MLNTRQSRRKTGNHNNKILLHLKKIGDAVNFTWNWLRGEQKIVTHKHDRFHWSMWSGFQSGPDNDNNNNSNSHTLDICAKCVLTICAHDKQTQTLNYLDELRSLCRYFHIVVQSLVWSFDPSTSTHFKL